MRDNQGFEYMPDTSSSSYIRNMYVYDNYICESQTTVKQMCSLFFVGQGSGVVLFFMPDKFGRLGTMKSSLIMCVLANYFICYSP